MKDPTALPVFETVKIENITDEEIDQGIIYARLDDGTLVKVNSIARPHEETEWFDAINEWYIYYSSESWKEEITSGYLYRLGWL